MSPYHLSAKTQICKQNPLTRLLTGWSCLPSWLRLIATSPHPNTRPCSSHSTFCDVFENCFSPPPYVSLSSTKNILPPAYPPGKTFQKTPHLHLFGNPSCNFPKQLAASPLNFCHTFFVPVGSTYSLMCPTNICLAPLLGLALPGGRGYIPPHAQELTSF